MEKEFKIISLKEYKDLLKTNKYLEIAQEDIIEKMLDYQGFVIIKEEEDPETLVSKLRIMPCEDVKSVLYKTEIIKDNLNKYAKEGTENPEKCTINDLRETLIKIKNHFGEFWSKDFVYSVDKYKIIKDLIKKCIKKEIPTIIITELLKISFHLLADKKSSDFVYFGNRFAKKIGILLRQEGLSKEDISNFLNCLLNAAGESYKKVYIDFIPLNKKVNYENIMITSDSVYELKGLDCRTVSVQNGKVKIYKSVVDGFVFGKNVEIVIDQVITEKSLKLTDEQKKNITIKRIVTYDELKAMRRRKAKESILKSTDNPTKINHTFGSIKKYA